MKRVLIVLSAFYLIISACSNPNAIESNTSKFEYPPIDTVKNAVIDTIMYRFGSQWRPGPNFHTIHLNATDSIEYIIVDGYAGRISAKFFTDTTATWVTAHQVNTDLKLMRFRQWRAKPQPNVQESICYFENGKIYYSRERNRVMGANDQLGSFREEAFKENFRSPDELMAEYMPYWETTIKAVDLDLLSKKQ